MQTTQRKMLRMILGRGRRRIGTQTQDDETSGEGVQSNAAEEEISEIQETVNDQEELEPFIDWIRRVTHEAESRLEALNLKTWVESARARKWRWASRILCTHGADRWARIAYDWDPRVHHDAGRRIARRRATGQRKRWFDDIGKFFVEIHHITNIPSQKEHWDNLEECFVKPGAQGNDASTN